jgi:hypothetical protein
LRNRSEQPARVAECLHPGILNLSDSHQYSPERQRKSEHLERERAALVAVHIKNRRGVQQNRSQPDAKLNGGLNIGTEDTVDDVSAKRKKSKNHAPRSDSGVIPTELRRAPHQARRDEYAQCHRHQEKLAHEKRNRRRRKGIENEMQRVCSPGQLPRAEVGLPALLVQIGKDKKQQN